MQLHAVRLPGQGDPSPAEAAAAKPMPGFDEAETARIAEYQPIVQREASTRALDPALINAVIWVESRFQADAKSPAGARGLMQLMPATAAYLAKELGDRRPKAHDPDFNIRAGSYYLSRLIERFDGDETLAIAAYNAGPGNVRKWQEEGKDLPDYSQDYVAKVMEARARFSQHPVDATAAPMMKPEPVAPAKAAPVGAGSVLTRVENADVVPAPSPDAGDEFEFDEPVFEPAPELDRAPLEPANPAARVAVSAPHGAWPPAPARTADAEETAEHVHEDGTQAFTAEAPRTQDESESEPDSDKGVGPGVLPDLGPDEAGEAPEGSALGDLPTASS